MTQPETAIRTAWRHVAGQHHDGFVDDLLIRYGEPNRHYHTATHIMFVVRHISDMSQASSVTASRRSPSHEVIAAALYHDAIYDARASDNEALSAALAVADLTAAGWPPDRCQSVAALIMATAGHIGDYSAESGDAIDEVGATDRAMLLDADLAILGADPAAYQAYAIGVRAEYSHVDDHDWRTGRSAVLQQFLDRRRVFITDYMFAAREHRARANMEAELAALRAG